MLSAMQERREFIKQAIAAGALSIRQLVARPRLTPNPYQVPVPGMYLCSSSTPPGPGVHGLCGANAALSALRRSFAITTVPDVAPPT